MKKLFLVLALLLAVSPALAQNYATDKGAVIIGGNASFTSSGGDAFEDFDGDRITDITVQPSAQYFVSPGLAIGGEVLFGLNSAGDDNFTRIGAGPALSYFFGGAETNLRPFVSAASLLARGSDGDFSQNFLRIEPSAGMAIFLSDGVAITGEAFFRYDNFFGGDRNESVSGNVFGISFGVQGFIF